MNKQPTRYHLALVALHWLLALILVFALGMGTFSLKELSNASPDKIGALRGHMIVGLVIGSLMLARLLTRVRTTLPASTSPPRRTLRPAGAACSLASDGLKK